MKQERQNSNIWKWLQTLKEAKWWILPLVLWGFLSPFVMPVMPFYSISEYLRDFLGSALTTFIALPFFLVTVPIMVFILGESGCLYGLNWWGLGIYWSLTILFCGLVGYILRTIFKLITKR